MAIKTVTVGSFGPFSYDDTLYDALVTTGQMTIATAPVASTEAVRKSDLDSGVVDTEVFAKRYAFMLS